MTRERAASRGRLPVRKTYKHYVGGGFIRSESGRVYPVNNEEGVVVAQCCHASRKDFRDAVGAARKAQPSWSSLSAFNRSQILFRIAEMLEDRRTSLEQHLREHFGSSAADARREVSAAVDRTFWYAGWADKFSQVLGGINPVASPFFNFTLPDPMGVVAVLPPTGTALLGLVSSILPVILSGNTCVVLADNRAPTLAVDLAEVLATSDVPGGVVNVLTGHRQDLFPTIATHRGIDAVSCFGGAREDREILDRGAADSVKRVAYFEDGDLAAFEREDRQSLYWIDPFVEWKTAWHPVGR